MTTKACAIRAVSSFPPINLTSAPHPIRQRADPDRHTVQRATAPFSVGGKAYPVNS
jgi:hypothetical protein